MCIRPSLSLSLSIGTGIRLGLSLCDIVGIRIGIGVLSLCGLCLSISMRCCMRVCTRFRIRLRIVRNILLRVSPGIRMRTRRGNYPGNRSRLRASASSWHS